MTRSEGLSAQIKPKLRILGRNKPPPPQKTVDYGHVMRERRALMPYFKPTKRDGLIRSERHNFRAQKGVLICCTQTPPATTQSTRSSRFAALAAPLSTAGTGIARSFRAKSRWEKIAPGSSSLISMLGLARSRGRSAMDKR